MDHTFRREKMYKEYLPKIKTGSKKEFLMLAISSIPDYFWTTQASQSGKYHPSWAVIDGGLARHTCMAVEIAIEMFPAYPELTSGDQEDIIIALILHDSVKLGLDASKYDSHAGTTFKEHPLYPRAYFDQARKSSNLPKRDYDRIMDMIETHMGIWGPHKDVTPQKKKSYRISPAEIVHVADYISSRRRLEILFKDGKEAL